MRLRSTALYPALPWVLLGIVLFALNLRTPIIAPTGIIPTIQDDTGLNAVGAGMLTGLPVLLFALATPLATRTIRRFGVETSIMLCLIGIVVGTIVRSSGPAAVVLTGTAILGVTIALGNIVVPVLIRRDVAPHRVSTVTGAYSASMNVGSMGALLTTAPLATAVGWRASLALWMVLALVALVFWGFWTRRKTSVAQQSDDDQNDDDASTATAEAPVMEHSAPVAPPARTGAIVMLLTLAFTGQSGAYYVVTTWLPTLLGDTTDLDITGSGAAASVFQIAAIGGAFGVPLLGIWFRRVWVPVAVMGTLWLVLPLGLLVAPELYVLWSLLGGIAQGGGFTAIFSIIPRVAGSDAQAASMSARVQTGGYLAATVLPPLAGGLNTLTGSWSAPLLLVLVLTITFCVGGLGAAKLSQRH